MSTDRDTTRIVLSWLRTDEHESADRVLDAVLDQLDTTPQRRASWLARRFSSMNPTMRLVLAAVAVVVVALLGLNFLVPGGGVGAPASPTPEPTAPTDGEPLAREWVDAVNAGDADALLSMMAERVDTDAGTLAREDKVADVLNTWCPMSVDSVERVGDLYLMRVTFTDNAGSTCTAGIPGTGSTFVLEVRDGKVTRIP